MFFEQTPENNNKYRCTKIGPREDKQNQKNTTMRKGTAPETVFGNSATMNRISRVLAARRNIVRRNAFRDFGISLLCSFGVCYLAAFELFAIIVCAAVASFVCIYHLWNYLRRSFGGLQFELEDESTMTSSKIDKIGDASSTHHTTDVNRLTGPRGPDVPIHKEKTTLKGKEKQTTGPEGFKHASTKPEKVSEEDEIEEAEDEQEEETGTDTEDDEVIGDDSKPSPRKTPNTTKSGGDNNVNVNQRVSVAQAKLKQQLHAMQAEIRKHNNHNNNNNSIRGGGDSSSGGGHVSAEKEEEVGLEENWVMVKPEDENEDEDIEARNQGAEMWAKLVTEDLERLDAMGDVDEDAHDDEEENEREEQRALGDDIGRLEQEVVDEEQQYRQLVKEVGLISSDSSMSVVCCSECVHTPRYDD